MKSPLPTVAILFAAAALAGSSVRAAEPATAPATQPSTPQEALGTFFAAMANGDRDRAFTLLWLPDAAAKREAEATIGTEIAKARLDNTLSEVFAEKPSPAMTSRLSHGKAVAGAMAKNPPKIDGDTAQIDSGDANTIFMVRRNNAWMIDFIKTQEGLGKDERPSAADLDLAPAKEKIYADLVDEVKNKKFISADGVRMALQRRMNAAGAGVASPENTNATRASLAMIKQALNTFEVDHDAFPTTAQGLNALVQQPAGMNDWHPYLEELPKDAWDHDFIYRKPSTKGKPFYDLFSPGPDGKPDTADDVSEAK